MERKIFLTCIITCERRELQLFNEVTTKKSDYVRANANGSSAPSDEICKLGIANRKGNEIQEISY